MDVEKLPWLSIFLFCGSEHLSEFFSGQILDSCRFVALVDCIIFRSDKLVWRNPSPCVAGKVFIGLAVVACSDRICKWFARIVVRPLRRRNLFAGLGLG